MFIICVMKVHNVKTIVGDRSRKVNKESEFTGCLHRFLQYDNKNIFN